MAKQDKANHTSELSSLKRRNSVGMGGVGGLGKQACVKPSDKMTITLWNSVISLLWIRYITVN